MLHRTFLPLAIASLLGLWSSTVYAVGKTLNDTSYCTPYQLTCTAYTSSPNSGIRCTLGSACDYGSPDVRTLTPFSCTGALCSPPTVSSLAFTTANWDSTNKICGIVSGKKHCWTTTSSSLTLFVTYLGECDANGDFCGDKDKDGVKDTQDKFPTNAAAAVDTDLDGMPDSWLPAFGCTVDAASCNGLVLDTDDDADGLQDVSDNCPLAVNIDQLDTDADGMGDVCDTDDDNDGVADGSDACPLDATASSGNNDGDFQCDVSDPDDDNDGVADVSDNCPLLSNASQLNTDGDTQGNACDTDDDNDGVPDASDVFPLDASESIDNDKDGVGNNADPDDDNDTVLDVSDNCPLVANASQQDADGDGIGDACDLDSPGRLDPSFVPGDVGGFSNNGPVGPVLVQKDGKVVLGVSTTQFIVRVDANGAVDTGFNRNGFGSSINSIIALPDEKILVAGNFSYYYSTPVGGILKLNQDGSRDTAFASGAGANAPISSMVIQSDGKILLGGNFTSFNGTAINRVARLNADGSLDTGFNPGSGANNYVFSVAQQGDGKILIGGWFTTINGVALNRLVRLNTDGSLDTSFVTGSGPSDAVSSIKIDRNGRILIAGTFTSYNGVPANRLARLNADGSLDTGFNIGTGADSAVSAVLLQADNKIILGGQFTRFNGRALNRIARLNPDGSVDDGFYPGTGADSSIGSLAMQADGKVFVGGGFFKYDGNQIAKIARIYTGDQDQDGVEDAADVFPQDALEAFDNDLDGIGNNSDPDDDNDGVPDAFDLFPLDANGVFPLEAPYRGSAVRESTIP